MYEIPTDLLRQLADTRNRDDAARFRRSLITAGWRP